MATLRANLPDLFLSRLAFLDEVLMDAIEIDDGVFKSILKMRTTDKPIVRTTGVATFGLVPVKAEGSDVVFDDLAQGFDTSFTPSTYELAFRTSKEALDDEQEETISDAARALGNSMSYTWNVNHADIFNNGFSSSFTGGDGKELFATDHPLVGGGTEQNELTTAADLSVASLRDALNDIGDTTDDAGKIIHWRPEVLLVPNELQWLASELMMSPGNPESPNLATNAFKERPDGRMKVVSSAYLTNADDWFLLARPEVHNIISYTREEPHSIHDWEFISSSFLTKVRARWVRGWSDWRGSFGSPGA